MLIQYDDNHKVLATEREFELGKNSKYDGYLSVQQD